MGGNQHTPGSLRRPKFVQHRPTHTNKLMLIYILSTFHNGCKYLLRGGLTTAVVVLLVTVLCVNLT